MTGRGSPGYRVMYLWDRSCTHSFLASEGETVLRMPLIEPKVFCFVDVTKFVRPLIKGDLSWTLTSTAKVGGGQRNEMHGLETSYIPCVRSVKLACKAADLSCATPNIMEYSLKFVRLSCLPASSKGPYSWHKTRMQEAPKAVIRIVVFHIDHIDWRLAYGCKQIVLAIDTTSWCQSPCLKRNEQ